MIPCLTTILTAALMLLDVDVGDLALRFELQLSPKLGFYMLVCKTSAALKPFRQRLCAGIGSCSLLASAIMLLMLLLVIN